VSLIYRTDTFRVPMAGPADMTKLRALFDDRVLDPRPRGRFSWRPYTVGLLASRVDGSLAKGERLTAIAGTPPDLAHLPRGCAFAPRCKAARPIYENAIPEEKSIRDEHLGTRTSGYNVCWLHKADSSACSLR
jgi:oligopeptide/dipeptide ABC transporter ATP-binding protein